MSDDKNDCVCLDNIVHLLVDVREKMSCLIGTLFIDDVEDLVDEENEEKLLRSELIDAHELLKDALHLCQFKPFHATRKERVEIIEMNKGE